MVKKSSSGKRKKRKNTTKKAHKSDIEVGVICGDGTRFATCQKCDMLGNTKREKAKACNSTNCRWDPFNHQCEPICQAPTMDGKPCTKTAATFGQINLLVEKIWNKLPQRIQAKIGEKAKYQSISAGMIMCKKHAIQQLLFQIYLWFNPWSTTSATHQDQDFRAQVQGWKYGEQAAHMRTGSDRWRSTGGRKTRRRCKSRRRKSRRRHHNFR